MFRKDSIVVPAAKCCHNGRAQQYDYKGNSDKEVTHGRPTPAVFIPDDRAHSVLQPGLGTGGSEWTYSPQPTGTGLWNAMPTWWDAVSVVAPSPKVPSVASGPGNPQDRGDSRW